MVDEGVDEIRAGLIIEVGPGTFVILGFRAARGVEVKEPYLIEVKFSDVSGLRLEIWVGVADAGVLGSHPGTDGVLVDGDGSEVSVDECHGVGTNTRAEIVHDYVITTLKMVVKAVCFVVGDEFG